jgi:NAD+ kinase
MGEMHMNVLLVPNYARPQAMAGARQLTEWLRGQGIEVSWTKDKKLVPNEQIDFSNVDLVVTLGGDGTLLRAARMVGYDEVPILGISYGHLGFLTCGQPETLLETVADALSGELHASHRMTLAVEAEFMRKDGDIELVTSFALNDLSLSHGLKGDMIVFDVSVSGHHIDRLRGDGFVISTATGSTGYALSAGGPIVTPEFAGMVCVPLACHTIRARAFLTSPSDVVELCISTERDADRLVFADGQPLGEGMRLTRVRVRRGPGDIILLDRSARSFYESVSRVFYGHSMY